MTTEGNANVKADEIDNLEECQELFFTRHEERIKNYWAMGKIEDIATEANFLLDQFKKSLNKNNKLKEANKYLGQQLDTLQNTFKQILTHHKHRDYLFFNALKSVYRMVDRTAGEEIRANLELNDKTQKQGEMKKLMEQMKRLA